MRMGRSWLTGLVLVGVMAAGCGGGDDPADEDQPTSAGSSAGSDTGDTGSGDAGTAALPVFCDLITAEEIGATIGATVTTSTGPFDACEFSQDDARALSGSLGATDVADSGGYEGYQFGTKATMDDPTRHEFDLGDPGDGAYVDIGTVFGGENLQVAGGVLVGDVIYTLNLAQGNGLSEDELVATSEALLQLMLDATA